MDPSAARALRLADRERTGSAATVRYVRALLQLGKLQDEGNQFSSALRSADKALSVLGKLDAASYEVRQGLAD